MDHNVATWMIAGGPRIEIRSIDRDRENLRAFRESQRNERVGLIDRLRAIVAPKPAELDPACCAA